MKHKSQSSGPSHIVFTGGGTAGHVWPHLALLDDPQSPLSRAYHAGQLHLHYMGSRAGMEKDIILASAIRFTYHGIFTGKLRRYFSFENFIDPFKVFLGILQSFFILIRHRPAVIFSKGGFVSAPTVWAAWVLRIPVVIHESDVTPALATKLSYGAAHHILCAFSETKAFIPERFRSKCLTTGLPLRRSLFGASRKTALEFFKLSHLSQRKTLLVFGGSLGAEGLNKRVAEALGELDDLCNVIHIVGRGKGFAFNENLQGYRQFEFLKDEMAHAYACSDLALCRAGASSLFELAAARIPMILVPLGIHQSRGDQYINAKIFAQHGWAVWLEESSLSPEVLVHHVKEQLAQLATRKEKLESSPGPDAALKVAHILSSFFYSGVH